MPELVAGCYALLASLEIRGSRWGKLFHTYRPALTKYGPFQWLWDSGWHMIVWSRRRPENAVADLRTMLRFQQPDGFIPGVIFWRRNRWLGKLAGFFTGYTGDRFSPLTQLPMLAYAVRAVWQAAHDKALLAEFVPPVVRFLEWWQSRDSDDDGLVSIIHPWESGMDASPVYDPVFHLDNPRFWDMYPRFWRLLRRYRRVGWDLPAILRAGWFNVEDVGVCSVYADNWGVLALLADEFDPALAARCRAQSRKYQAAVIRKCWDGARGQFVSYYHRGGVEIASPAETIQTLLPLLLDDLPLNLQHELVRKINDPSKFWLPYPVPSVAMSETTFNPGKSGLLWRGPMWPAANWLVMEGLLKHGFKTEAAAILDRWTELYLKHGIWEYYNPLTGKGLGQPGLGMSTIIIDMLARLGRI